MNSDISELVRAEPDQGHDFEADDDRLIFPVNVQESVAASGSLKRSERNGIIISFWIFGCAILAWLLASFLRGVVPRYYVWITIAVEVVLQLTVGVIILRIISDEGTMAAELSKQDNSFAKYFAIYHEVLAGEDTPYPFDMIEFSDGSYGVYIQFLLGYNTDRASTGTYEVNKAIQRAINKSGMDHRVVFCNERFGNSDAADKMRAVVSKISDPKLFKAYRDIVQGLLKTANEESNVVCTTYILYAKTQIQKEELVPLVNNIMTTVSGADTAYREVSVLSYEDIVEFYRNYYKLDLIDMGLIRVHQVQRKGVQCALRVLKVYGDSGKVYTTEDYAALQRSILEADGLRQVNKVS